MFFYLYSFVCHFRRRRDLSYHGSGPFLRYQPPYCLGVPIYEYNNTIYLMAISVGNLMFMCDPYQGRIQEFSIGRGVLFCNLNNLKFAKDRGDTFIDDTTLNSH